MSTTIEIDHHQEGPDTRLDVDLVEEEAAHRLVDDPRGGDQQQPRLDKGRQVLDPPVAVAMLAVGRLPGEAHGDEGDRGGDEIERGVQRLGQDTEAAGENPDG